MNVRLSDVHETIDTPQIFLYSDTQEAVLWSRAALGCPPNVKGGGDGAGRKPGTGPSCLGSEAVVSAAARKQARASARQEVQRETARARGWSPGTYTRD